MEFFLRLLRFNFICLRNATSFPVMFAASTFRVFRFFFWRYLLIPRKPQLGREIYRLRMKLFNVPFFKSGVKTARKFFIKEAGKLILWVVWLAVMKARNGLEDLTVNRRVIGSVRYMVRVVDCIHVTQGVTSNMTLKRWKQSLGFHKLRKFVDSLRNC